MTKHNVQIDANTKKYQTEFARASKSNTAFTSSLKGVVQGTAAIDGPLGGISSRISNMASMVKTGNIALVAMGAAVAGLSAATFKSIKVFDQYQKQQLRTEALVKATGAAAGFSAKELAKQADEVALNTLASVGGIVEAQNVLLTFKTVSGDTFKQAIKLSQDMAATFGGSARDKALQLGKALEDPINGLNSLRRSGVSFTETEKDMIRSMQESGNLAEAQGIILEKLAGQVGGAGAAEAGGLSGAVDTLGQRWDDLLNSWANTSGSGETATSWITKISNGLKGLRGVIAPTIDELENKLANLEALREKEKQGPGGYTDTDASILEPLIKKIKNQILTAKAESDDLDAIEAIILNRREQISDLDASMATAGKSWFFAESKKEKIQEQKALLEQEIEMYTQQAEKINQLEEQKIETQKLLDAERKAEAKKKADEKAKKEADELAKKEEANAKIIEQQQRHYAQIHENALAAMGQDEELEDARYQQKLEQMTKELDALREKGLLTQEIEAEHKKALEELEIAHMSRISQIRLEEQEKIKQREEKQKAEELAKEEAIKAQQTELYQGMLATMSSYFDGMQGKRAKYANAALSIGQTLMDEEKRENLNSIWGNTYSAAMKAYDSLSDIPYVGPILGAAAAGIIIAAGTAYAAKVTGLASFEGGGSTGNGMRTGGLDNKGGFLAMLHPQEHVIDLTKPNAAGLAMNGGGNNISVALHVTNNDQLNFEKQVKRSIKTIKRELDAVGGAPL